MAVTRKPDTCRGSDPYGVFDAHRLEMIELMRQIDAEAGVPEEPAISVEELREQMVASGIRPEDNLFSREIIRMRYDDSGPE